MITLSYRPSARNLSLLFVVTFLLRAALFYSYIQHNERYHQPDSFDYHICAVLIAHKGTMTRFDVNEPIFWRTPGYPAFLAPFYWWQGIKSADFSPNAAAQKASIWAQIFLTSCIPILLFFLAFTLTSNLFISWLMAWISCFHIGFILASTYLLTDALASLFFYLFLLFFYRVFYWYGDAYSRLAHSDTARSSNTYNKWALSIIGAALALAAYTWMRPMGKFVVIISAALLLFDNTTFFTRIKKIALLLFCFFVALSPWYIRNYNITGKIFFCPMSGGVMQAFVVPKLMRRATGWSYVDCLKQGFQQAARVKIMQDDMLRHQGSVYQNSMHLICTDLARPWITHYPGYFAYDWLAQACKTAFDLHAYQLVAFHTNTFMADPPEEFLDEKIAACLYTGQLPFVMRLLSWIEALFFLLLWIGLFGGLWAFILKPLLSATYSFFSSTNKNSFPPQFYLWMKTGPLIGAVILMTGGFGYARLRIPIEPLMIILALTFWVHALNISRGRSS